MFATIKVVFYKLVAAFLASLMPLLQSHIAEAIIQQGGWQLSMQHMVIHIHGLSVYSLP